MDSSVGSSSQRRRALVRFWIWCAGVLILLASLVTLVLWHRSYIPVDLSEVFLFDAYALDQNKSIIGVDFAGCIHVWDSHTGKHLMVRDLQLDSAVALSVAPEWDNLCLVGYGRDEAQRLYVLSRSALLPVANCPWPSSTFLTRCTAGGWLLGSSFDSQSRERKFSVWRLSDGVISFQFDLEPAKIAPNSPAALAAIADARAVECGTILLHVGEKRPLDGSPPYSELWLYSLDQQQLVRRVATKVSAAGHSLTRVADGARYALAYNTKMVQVYSLPDLRVIDEVHAPAHSYLYPSEAQVSPDGRWLVYAGDRLVLYDIHNHSSYVLKQLIHDRDYAAANKMESPFAAAGVIWGLSGMRVHFAVDSSSFLLIRPTGEVTSWDITSRKLLSTVRLSRK